MYTSLIVLVTLVALSYGASQTIGRKGPSATPLPVNISYVNQIDSLIADMSSRWQVFDSTCDSKAPFCLMYLHMTYGLRDHIRDLYFDNGELMSDFTFKFAHRYFQWLDADKDSFVAPVWVDAFDYGRSRKSSVTEDLFLGMNAHINFDLGQIVYEMNYKEYKDDFDRINDILNDAMGPIMNDIAARYDYTMNSTLIVALAPLMLEAIEGWRANAWLNGVSAINLPLLRGNTLHNMGTQALLGTGPYKSYNLIGLGLPTAPARQAYCSANHSPLNIV